MTARSRRTSRYLGTVTQADLDSAAAAAEQPVELTEDERDFHDDIVTTTNQRIRWARS